MVLRIAVLLSGGGTTLENLLVRAERNMLDIEVAVVIATKDDAYGLVRAHSRSIPTAVVRPHDYSSNEEFSGALTEVIRQYTVDLIVLAGFMFFYHIPDEYINSVLNVHPSLIPAFCGKGYYGHHVHEAVLRRGVKFTGCTVHFVDNKYDHGPILIQKVVEVHDDDTPDSLAERVQAAEREALPEAISLIVSQRVIIDGNRVYVRS